MAYPAPFVGSSQRVEDQWIDYNGHFNMAYYNVIFDRCGDEAFALVGLGPDYVKSANSSFFTLEAHVTYLRELHAGDEVRVTVQIPRSRCQARALCPEMFHAREGWLACVSENIVIHVDMAAKKTVPFPPLSWIKSRRCASLIEPLPCRRRSATGLAFRGSDHE